MPGKQLPEALVNRKRREGRGEENKQTNKTGHKMR